MLLAVYLQTGNSSMPAHVHATAGQSCRLWGPYVSSLYVILTSTGATIAPSIHLE